LRKWGFGYKGFLLSLNNLIIFLC